MHWVTAGGVRLAHGVRFETRQILIELSTRSNVLANIATKTWFAVNNTGDKRYFYNNSVNLSIDGTYNDENLYNDDPKGAYV